MLEQLSQIKQKYHHLKTQLEDPEILKNRQEFAAISQEFHHIEQIYHLIKTCEDLSQKIEENKILLKEEKDPEILALAKEELQNFSKDLTLKKEELKIKLLPEDPNDKKNVILEIRAGAGGDEASLFVQDLFSAYSSYAESQSWTVDIISISEGNLGGYKEVIASISGHRVYSALKYESGVHRVQRVPKTESQGRIHTSTVTVAVLPEADPVHVQINPSDLRIDVLPF